MAEDQSYSPEELSKILRISKGTVYDLIKRGEIPSYRIGKKIRVRSSDLEVYTRSGQPPSPSPISQAFRQAPPEGSAGFAADREKAIILCGQDMILDVLTRHLAKKNPLLRSLRSCVGSMDGLMALYRGNADAAAAHLWDGETEEYNLPYVRRLLPGRRTIIVNLVYRAQGFYVAQGNPKNIADWADLLRNDVFYVNREIGSGTRALLDEHLRKLNMDARMIKGYSYEEMSHMAVASAVARSKADVGLGTEKGAKQVMGVDFVPLMKERYDLVFYREDLEKPEFQTLLAVLRSSDFVDEVRGMGGYDTSLTGEIVGEV